MFPSNTRRFLWFSLACWLLVAILASGIVTGASWIGAIDTPIVRVVTQSRPAWLTQVLLAITTLGNPINVTLITTICTLWLLWRRRGIAAGRLVLTVALGSLGNRLLKAWIARPRPFIANTAIHPLVGAGGWSFPSGHANGTTLLYGTLIALLWLSHLPRRWQWLGTVAGSAMILLTAYSRVYVQVHYPTDVLAGMLAGIGLITLGLAVTDRTD